MTKQATARAFVAGRAARCHNASTDGARYTLHKSDIARKEDGKIVFDWCGFYTATTASHMNAILRELPGSPRVSYAAAREGLHGTFEVAA